MNDKGSSADNIEDSTNLNKRMKKEIGKQADEDSDQSNDPFLDIINHYIQEESDQKDTPLAKSQPQISIDGSSIHLIIQWIHFLFLY